MKRGEFDSYSRGRDTEEGVLGKLSRSYEQEFPGEETWEKRKEVREKREQEPYSLTQLYEISKDYQPPENADPAEPGKPFANRLREEVMLALGLDFFKPKENTNRLKFYTSVGYHLDDRGVDAFLELEMGSGDFVRFPIDLKTNPKEVSPEEGVRTESFRKGDEGRERVLFYYPPDGFDMKTESKDFFKKAEQVGVAVADGMKREIARRGLVLRELSEYEIDEGQKIQEENRQAVINTLPRRMSDKS